ncbi:MAG: Ig-like domain-containing protein, partial [Pseudomonadota bacterium]|nr:Ig-like domain-containing protein [Pseudomonadota bacterium]
MTLTATVSGLSPSGPVVFKDGTTTLGSATVSAGTASFSATFAAAGTHSLTAAYSGDANNAASTSAAVVETVNAATSSVVLTSGTNPAAIGQAIMLTATVSGVSPTGGVTFKDGTTTLGTATLSAGTATLNTTFSSTGTHSLIAVYGGDANNAANTSPLFSQTINAQVATTTTITSSANPAYYGQALTVTATVSGSNPTGTVSFKDGSTTVGSASVSGGTASRSFTFSVGSHSLTAVYSGDTANAASTSATLTQQIILQPTATTLTATPNPSGINQVVSLKATVVGVFPTGTVTFKDGATTLGSSSVGNGIATYNALFSAGGTHTLTAVYSGDTYNATSTSAAFAQSVGVQTPTTTTIASSYNPSYINSTVRLSATVTGNSPSGSVVFMDGTVVLGSGTLGVNYPPNYAYADVVFRLGASHALTAVYNGDANNTASVSSVLTQAVTLTPTSLVIRLQGPDVVAPGGALNIAVDLGGGTYGNHAGTLTFYDGAAVVGTGSFPGYVSSSYLTIYPTTLGVHTLTAVYGNDQYNAGSTSPAITATVSRATLSASPSTAKVFQTVTLTAATGDSDATGTVTFRDGSTTIGSAPLVAGVATLTTTFATPGSHSLSMSYAGDGTHAATVSPPIVETIGLPAITSMTLAASPGAAAVGQTVA